MRRARCYLDWNATTPLRPEARAAMLAAMDEVGNPSSVHAEGRRAKGVVERARAQVASACGAEASDIVFVSSATEGAALVLAEREIRCAPVEHEAVLAWCRPDLAVSPDGSVDVGDPADCALQVANSETGILQNLPAGLALVDATQAIGKVPYAFEWTGASAAIVSAHKFGGPKGVAAVLLRRGSDVVARISGGGQEMGRRSGTENVVGIAGMGAAAEAASRDLADGMPERVAELRNILELSLASGARNTILVGNTGDTRRLPNTTCLVTPGWKGETQVMAMDLAGFAVSAGSACSSGKVRPSQVLAAMGFDPVAAASAIRVSLGPDTQENDVMRFAEAWLAQHDRYMARSA